MKKDIRYPINKPTPTITLRCYGIIILTKSMELVKMDKVVTIKNKILISEWSEMVRACRSSGLTVQQWCNSNGINIKTYYYRLRKVRKALCEETHDIVQIPLNTVNSAVAASSIKINIVNLNVELPDTISAATLVSVIEALKC